MAQQVPEASYLESCASIILDHVVFHKSCSNLEWEHDKKVCTDLGKAHLRCSTATESIRKKRKLLQLHFLKVKVEITMCTVFSDSEVCESSLEA